MNRTGITRAALTALFTATVISAATAAGSAPSALAAARFLEQASWGATPASVADVQQLGFDTWLSLQMDPAKTPPSTIPPFSVDAKGNTSLRPVQDAFFSNAVTGLDQLRQRVAFALAQIWVVSGVKLRPEAIQPYLQLLQADAFSSYDKIMYDVTVSPGMGHYLDMVNNNKPTPGHGADENYAREILQLFTIGLVELDWSGNVKIDPATGLPIPTYTQDTIEGFANVFTGWTYAPKPGATSRFPNPANWTAPMVPFDANHAIGAKALLNGQVVNNGSGPGVAVKDLTDALANIFNHPNVAPFISRQLIQHLVTSSPSPAYVKNVADVFTQTQGDMKAVIKAVLLDPEARAGDDGVTQTLPGHLSEPVLFINALMRELNANVSASNNLTNNASLLGQTIYYPPTVFNYFLPGYQLQITGSSPPATTNAPEFELLSGATAQSRADFVNSIVFGKVGGVTVDLSSYITILGTKPSPSQLERMLQGLNTALLGGRMTSDMHDTILTAVQAATTPKAMVQTAVYLIGSSWPYQVQQ